VAHKREGDVPYISNAGCEIHYEVDGIGRPLVLQHGFTDSLEAWSEYGYVSPLRAKYRLILVDARGHGGSDKPHDEACYMLEHRVADVISVLDALDVERANFWGYSMGGWIGLGMAKYAPQRVDALVIGGQHPFARDQSGFRQWLRSGITEGSNALVSAFEKMVGPISNAYASRLRAGDLNAWLASVEDRESIEDVLETMTMPCCLYAGESDPLFAQTKLASERISNSQFLPLPGLSHIQTMAASNRVLPPIMEFLEATN
jgi:pimeloyl-ACP methyl ester carboxylesterase